MPSGSYRQVHVLCPFYQWDDGGKRICCEGAVDGTTMATLFRRRGALQQHMRIFCEDAYACCELYRAVMEKYDDEGDET